MPEHLAVILQQVLPKRQLTSLAGRIVRARGRGVTTALVRWFVARYGVDMGKAVQSDPASYETLNAFCTMIVYSWAGSPPD